MSDVQVEIARSLLPPMPCEVGAWSVATGRLSLRLEAMDAEGVIHSVMSSFDAHDGMHLVVPLNEPRGGGYDLLCQVGDKFFRRGIDVDARLFVRRVERRKQVRAEVRAPLNELCLVKLLSHAAQCELDGRLSDISREGVGFTSDRRLETGDCVELASRLGDAPLHCTAVVLNCSPAPFGRFRTGCRIVAATAASRAAVDEFVEANGMAFGSPAQRRLAGRHFPV